MSRQIVCRVRLEATAEGLLQQGKKKAAHSGLDEGRSALLVGIESFIAPQAQLLRLRLQVAVLRLRWTMWTHWT